MDIFNLLIGLSLSVLGSYYLYYLYTNRSNNKREENFKYSLMHYDIKIAGTVIVFIMIGVITIYREIKMLF